jgi:hypothetical protein
MAGGYYVCGATTNGLIGTHLIPLCLPIMPSEHSADGDRRPKWLIRYVRLSAQVDGAEHPCRAEGVCAPVVVGRVIRQ